MKKSIIACSFVFSFTLLFAFTSGCERQGAKKPVGPAEKVAIGVAFQVMSAPIIIAIEKGYFKDEALDVTVKEYAFGRLCLEAMLGGEVDMATVADMPVVMNSFRREDYLILSEFAYNYDESKIVARKDRGIIKPPDLKGKKIGVTFGTSAHFFLSVFLNYHEISVDKLKVVNISASELPSALESGKVDAIAVFEPYAYNALQMSGERAIRFPQIGIHRETFNLVAKKDFAEKAPETLKRVIRGIDMAVLFIKQNKQEAISITAKKLKLDTKALYELWDNYVFGLSLDQSLILSLEDRARWAVNNRITDNKDIPNYMKFIHQDALKEIKPEAVTIIQ